VSSALCLAPLLEAEARIVARRSWMFNLSNYQCDVISYATHVLCCACSAFNKPSMQTAYGQCLDEQCGGRGDLLKVVAKVPL
jgi:hypothetical protein